MKYYLAYGSNLNDEWMKKLSPASQRVGAYWLEGADLVFRGKGYLTLKFHGAAEGLPLALWQVDEEAEKALDAYESYPVLYRRECREIEWEGEKQEAFVYLMNPPYDEDRVMPDPAYVEKIVKGYENCGFDPAPLHKAMEEIGYCQTQEV